jgi:hypothetical protein
MNILAIAQVEDRKNLDRQIAKQTVQPDHIFMYIDTEPAHGIDARRKRIAHNHKRLREAVVELQPDFIWQVEQDGDYSDDCLQKLIDSLETLERTEDNVAYISGIQVGRHGLYCLGAWKNFTDASFESLDFKLTGLQEVEATGFYCLLARTDKWLSGQCNWTNEPYGPDVVWSRSITGKKYCDMNIPIGHIVKRGIIRVSDASTCNAKFYLENNRWKFKQL